MNTTERVISSIERVLALGEISPDIDGRELAQEYAALCQAANERLLQCVRHIDSGNLRAAMNISESPPPLLDHCTALDFDGAASWRALAQKNGWPLAEPINAKATQQINDAYSSALNLDPILAQFSNAAQRKDYRDCTRLLRRIINLDPKTPAWRGDLKNFEDRRIPEVARELRAAEAAQNLVKLKDLQGELNEKWLDPRSDELRRLTGAALQRVQEQKAAELGREIVAEISKHYAAFDCAGLERSLSAYQALLDKGYFKPESSMALQFEEAKSWFEQDKAAKEKERQYQDRLAELEAELEKDAPNAKSLEALWRVLTSEGRSLRQDLEQRTLDAIETCHLLARRRRWRQIALSAAAAVLLMTTAVAVICRIQYKHLLAFYGSQLEQAVEEHDLEKMLSLKAGIQKHAVIGELLYRSPRIQESLAREQTTSNMLAQDTRRIQDLIAGMERVAQAHFADDAEFVRSQAEASNILATTPVLNGSPVYQDSLTALADIRRLHWEGKITQTEMELQGILTNIQGQLPSREAIESGKIGNLDRRMGAVDSLVQAAQVKAEELRALYAVLHTKGSDVLESLDAAVKEVNARRAESGERQAFVIKLAKADSLTNYLAACQSFEQRFPKDPLAQAISNVLASRKEFAFFVAPPWKSSAALTTAELESISDSTPAENYFWDIVLQNEVNARKGIERKWPEIVQSIRAFEDDKQMVGLVEFNFRNTDGRLLRVFAYDDFGKNKTGIIGVESYDMGTVYVPKADDIRAEFKPLDRGVKTTLVKNLKPMAHCTALRAIADGVHTIDAAEGGAFLLRATVQIGNNGSMLNSLLQLRLLKVMLGYFIEMVGNGAFAEADAALTDMEAVDDDSLDPFCVENPFVVDAAKKSDPVIRKYFKDTNLVGNYQFQEAIRRECIQRGAQWVGHADFSDPFKVWVVTGKKTRELWVLRPGGGKEKIVQVVAELGPNGEYMIGEKLAPGEPLFAPVLEAGRTTRDVLDQALKKSALKKAPDSMPWPPAWPVNRRR